MLDGPTESETETDTPWLLWEGGERTFPLGLVASSGSSGKEQEEEAASAAEMDVVPTDEAEENAAATAAAGGGDEARDEEAFSRLASADADESTAAAAAAASSSSSSYSSMETDAPAGRISYRGLVRVLVYQCDRPHRDYRRAAVAGLAELSLAFPGADVWSLGEETLVRLAGGRELASSSTSSGDAGGGSGVDHVLRARAIEALGALFPPAVTASAYQTQKAALPWLLPMLLARAGFTVWSLRQAVFRAMRRVVERIHVSTASEKDGSGGSSDLGPTLLTGAVVEKVVGSCLQGGGLGDGKYHQVRVAALEVLLALIKRPEADARLVLAPQSERVLAALDKVVAQDAHPPVVMLATEARALLRART